MEEQHPHINPLDQEEPSFSLKNQLTALGASLLQALKQFKIWLPVALLGGALAVAYNAFKPIDYTARISFVVEDTKSGGMGGSLMSALAGQIGLDIGGMSGANGVLAGDNVLMLLKSRSLIKKTLLSPLAETPNQSMADKANLSLADAYADEYGLRKKWAKSSKVGKEIFFTPGAEKLSRTADSLLQIITNKIIEKHLSVAKPDKRLGFFEMSTTLRNENLSYLFCTRLLKTTLDFYIETKTRRLVTNVKRLQNKADSLLAGLNRKTFSSANANRMLLDANPAFAAPEATVELTARDKMIQGTIYAEIMKNLEISKTSLIQETPTVQVVDPPESPLPNNHQEPWRVALMGAVLAFALALLALVLAQGKK